MLGRASKIQTKYYNLVAQLKAHGIEFIVAIGKEKGSLSRLRKSSPTKITTHDGVNPFNTTARASSRQGGMKIN
jgi:phospholipase/lecithinase/hemolysin